MKSQEYKDLMDALHNQKKKIDRIDISIGKSEHAKLTFADGSFLELTEGDAVNYVMQFKKGVDNDGDYVFRQIKDSEKYFKDEEFLYRNHGEKTVAAGHELAAGTFKFSYDVDELQKEFLLSKTRNDKKFEPLKRDYFYIAAHRLNENAAVLALHDKHMKTSKDYEKYFLAICKILSTAFRDDKNFIKNFARKDKKAKLDLFETMRKYASTLEYAKDVQPLFNSSGVPMNAGINLVLNTYRKNAEACVELLNFVRIAYEFNNGEDQPVNEKKAQVNKQILQPELATLLDCLDPHLRNSESHLKTQLDHENHKLIASDQGGYVAQYTYSEIVDMTNDLTHNLLPALMTAVMMESLVVMLILSYRSSEYITALIGIDNS